MTMNGDAMPRIALSNPIVDLLEKSLAEAKAGNLVTIGFVAVAQNGATAVFDLGGRLGDLYTGAGILQHRVMAKIEAPQQRSPIIRAAVGG